MHDNHEHVRDLYFFAFTCSRHSSFFSINTTASLLLLLPRINEELAPILETFESANLRGVTETKEHDQYATSFLTQV